MKFRTFTGADLGQPIFINLEHVVCVRPALSNNIGAVITILGGAVHDYIHVAESFADVQLEIEEADGV